MAQITTSELREMSPEERRNKLKDVQAELMTLRGNKASGHTVPMIYRARKEVARIKTVMRELGDEQQW
jgi:ribosomal protein L29